MANIKNIVAVTFEKLSVAFDDLIQVGYILKNDAGAGSPSSSEPDDGSASDPVPTRMIVFEVEDERIDGTNIQAGDYQVLIEPTSVELTLNDRIQCDRGILTVKNPGRLAPAGVTAMYDAVCRG